MNTLKMVSSDTSLVSKISRRLVLEYMLHLKNYNENNNHLIFSDPRGGSTWLMELIQQITNEPVIFEPLHLKYNKDDTFRNLNFGWRQHIPVNAEWKEAEKAFDALFTGKLLNHGVFQYSTLHQCLKSESFLFKFVFGSALLPWLASRYTFKYKPLYMVRHPFAVVSSQLKHGAWEYPFDKYIIPDTPYNDNYLEHQEFLNTLKTKEESLVVQWCLANQSTLSHKKNNIEWITLNYEEFIVNPKLSMERILQEWGLKYDLSKIDFEKNSSTTKKGSPQDIIKRISHWKNNFNNQQINKMLRVLDYFDVSCYSERFEPEIIYNYGVVIKN